VKYINKIVLIMLTLDRFYWHIKFI